MAKVIVERPRGGWRINKKKGDRRELMRLPQEEWAHRAPMLGRLIRSKHLSEHLSPLRRFLYSRVGQPWDKVFSEICANINRGSAVQDHVRDHVYDYVEVQVVMIDGKPCSASGRSYGQPLDDGFYWKRLYVCPKTGTLRKLEEKKRRRYARGQDSTGNSKCVKVGKSIQCWLLGETWYVVHLLPLFLPRRSASGTDVLLGKPVNMLTDEEVRKKYGAAVYAAAKRPLSKRELKQWPIPLD